MTGRITPLEDTTMTIHNRRQRVPMPLLSALAALSLLTALAAPAAAGSKLGIVPDAHAGATGSKLGIDPGSVAVAVYYDVGSRNEVKGRSGFAHLFEHMMFQGSANVGKAEHFQYVENNGGVLNGSTHVDFTNYYQFLPSNQLELALWLEADRMRSLRITAVNLKNRKDAVKEEKRMNVDNQAYWPALTRMDEMVFRNWANAHPIVGSMEDLDAATVADVQKFFYTYYAPNNAVLAVAGDLDVAARCQARHFGQRAQRRVGAHGVDVSIAQERKVGIDLLGRRQQALCRILS